MLTWNGVPDARRGLDFGTVKSCGHDRPVLSYVHKLRLALPATLKIEVSVSELIYLTI
jgi:hypothetical protein